MVRKIPYLILQAKSLDPCSILAAGFADNLPEDGKVQDLLDHAASKIPSHLKLDVSQVVMEPMVYTVLQFYILPLHPLFFIRVS
jgi:hypothetical protein